MLWKVRHSHKKRNNVNVTSVKPAFPTTPCDDNLQPQTLSIHSLIIFLYFDINLSG